MGRNINVRLPLTWPPLGTLPTTQAHALTGNRTGNPLIHRPALNPLSHASQGEIHFFIIFPNKSQVLFILRIYFKSP